MKTFKLYFNDLNPEAQKQYLKFQGVTDADDLNWQICPITILEIEDETENSDV